MALKMTLQTRTHNHQVEVAPSPLETTTMIRDEISVRTDDLDETGSNATDREHEAIHGEKSDGILGGQETKSVVRLKLALLGALISSAIGVALTTYFHLSNVEEKQFRHQFEDDSHKVLDAIGKSLDRTLGMMDSVAVAYVSQSKANNESFPFVTLPEFALRMSKALPFSDAITLTVLPVVQPSQRDDWEKYSVSRDGWVDESMAIQESWGKYHGPITYNGDSNPTVHGDYGDMPRNLSRITLPGWQTFPVIANDSYTYNYDWLSADDTRHLELCLKEHKAVVSDPFMIPTPGDSAEEMETEMWAEFYRNFIQPNENAKEPISDITYPIVDETSRVWVAGANDYDPNAHSVVALIVVDVFWRTWFRDILPQASTGIHVVVTNPCGNAFTYKIVGEDAKFIGVGDLHETKHGNGISSTLRDLAKFSKRDSAYSGAKLDHEFCPLSVHLYASDEMRSRFVTNSPMIFTVGVVLIFAFSLLVFYQFERKVERRQEKVLKTAVRSTAIISDLFPDSVRDRLYPVNHDARLDGRGSGNHNEGHPGDEHDSNEVIAPDTDSVVLSGSPIAELYPETTVLFADIVGFTAWSSARSPTQVFHLLETLYGGFDSIARKRGVFKVETIGDCYVAVVGLPKPKTHHAIVMARFANDIRKKMRELTVDLEATLGEGTAELALRIGLNSGPTTAGVLRGEKSRFQLFGDTVNTAARMESNGQRNKIHISQKTAELIELGGKGHWLTRREKQLDCKGKGKLTTFFCEPNSAAMSSTMSCTDGSFLDELTVEASGPGTNCDVAFDRIIGWNVDLLHGLLKKIVQAREGFKCANVNGGFGNPSDEEISSALAVSQNVSPDNGVNGNAQVAIHPNVLIQLRTLVATVASKYRSNAFYNIYRSSHVAMSTVKLLGHVKEHARDISNVIAMAFDPMTEFAIVFAALAHHRNPLVQEDHFDEEGVTEQTSVCIAWDILMESSLTDLRCCLFASENDANRFRQILVKAGAAATDLRGMDVNATLARPPNSEDNTLSMPDSVDMEATNVLKLIVQASHVSHAMQHFSVYQKWTVQLWDEMYYQAYTKSGHGRHQDPTADWFCERELQFFDNIVIPLAQKLQECQVFGASCDAYMDNARDNRREWKLRGQDIIVQAKAKLQAESSTAS